MSRNSTNFFCYITDAFKAAEADDDDSEEDMDSDATEEQGSTEDEDTPDEDEEDEEEYIGGDFNEDVSYIHKFYSVYIIPKAELQQLKPTSSI